MTPWLVAAPALFAAFTTAVNLLTWPRGGRGTSRRRASEAEPTTPEEERVPRVSVLIPARNEEDNIEACVRAALAQPVDEVVVCDDASTDRTPEILDALAAADPRLRVVRAPSLPEGWIGKVHACHVLAGVARGEVLVLVDADVTLAPGGLARLLSLLEDAEVVTALPAQRMETFAEGLLLPLLHLTYTSWLPLALIPRTRDPRILAANGQILAVRAADHATLGGFAAIRSELADDMAYCRRAKEHGLRVVFADGSAMASCRMYRSAPALWDGFSKNLFEGLGENLPLLAAVVALYATAFVLPYPWALAAWAGGAPWGPALAALAANLVTRAALAWRFGHPWWSVVLHPLGVVALLALAGNSVRWWARGAILWRGRAYSRRSARTTA